MWLLLIVCLLVLLFYITHKYFKYWEKRDVPGPRPLPLFGNIASSILGLRNVGEVYADIYRKYEDCPFVGVYRLGQPCLMIRDPELIKNVLIKNFNHFMENEIFADKDVDPLLARNTFVLKGEEWKKTRQFVTPNFAGLKIKTMFPLAENVSKNLVTYLEKQEDLELNAKDVFVKYNCDLVAVCGFGIEGNSFEDPNAFFVNLARKFATPGSLQGLKIALSFLLPKLINLKLVSKDFDDGVIGLTNETLKYRRENNIKRNDFLDAVSTSSAFSPIEIAAHMANLIIDGFESSSTVMTFVLHELAANTECQEKLRKDINTVLKKYDGNLTYEAMKEMAYLDACVNESLRLHPPLFALGKICTQQYTMTSSSTDCRNISVTVDKGTPIIIPVLGIHRDPKYYPSPEKYIPERFLDKTDSFKHVYLPFGSGPRMCLGSQFGLMQVKIGIVQVIKNFNITLSEKTKQPLQYDPIYFSLYPKGGVWFKCKKIESAD